jgi:uncharacterized peroxidase-related enzyme
MAHIQVPEGVPGIRSLVIFRPETGKPLYELAQVLLRGESTLTEADRELIAAYVSHLNDCHFCMNSHAAAARCLLGEDTLLIDLVLKDVNKAPVSAKMKALLHIAAQVQRGGKNVTKENVEAARNQGATDREIHDTVLIAAAFCMFNRYVDGLDSFTPIELEEYKSMGERMARNGYQPPI